MAREIVCLCGSTRFWRWFQAVGLVETLAGRIVLSIGAARGDDGETFAALDAEEWERVKGELDALHLDKIGLADRVIVLNVGGYAGESTAREVAHALELGRPVEWLEAPAGPLSYLEGPYTGYQAAAGYVRQWEGQDRPRDAALRAAATRVVNAWRRPLSYGLELDGALGALARLMPADAPDAWPVAGQAGMTIGGAPVAHCDLCGWVKPASRVTRHTYGRTGGVRFVCPECIVGAVVAWCNGETAG